MNILGEECWVALKELQNNQGVKIVQLPTPDRFVINLDSREIQFPEKYQGENKKLFGVEGDAFADTIYFEVDRYFDDVDLFQTTILIEYVNSQDKVRVSPAILKDPYSKEDKLLFAWSLTQEATYPGDLKFLVHFYSVSQETREFTYSLRTLPSTVHIPDSIRVGLNELNGELDIEYSFTAAEIQVIYDKITEESKIHWTDL